MPAVTPVRVGDYTVGGGAPLLWIAGPCVIESRDFTLKIADDLRAIAEKFGLPLVFKASFDKANRTSVWVVPWGRARRRTGHPRRRPRSDRLARDHRRS